MRRWAGKHPATRGCGARLLNRLNRFYSSLDGLVKVLNTFASLQGYAIVKRYIKVSKNGELRKAVLIYNRCKEYIDENRSKRDTASQKTNCSFNAIAILKEGR